jgi:hypothetical protein
MGGLAGKYISNFQRGDPPSISSKVEIHKKWIWKSGFIKVTVYFNGNYGSVAVANRCNNF